MSEMDRPTSFERARRSVIPVMAAGSACLEPELRRIVEYHWGWLDCHGEPSPTRAGKALRPALAMLAAEAVGAETEVALAGAAALEMIHDFTLLHDDVMDQDEERRGRPTAWACFGVGPAICAGDALVLLAQQVLLADPSEHRREALSELLAATQEVIAGQALDLAFEGRVDISVDDYLGMSGKKTGALLGGSAAIGGILGGGSTSQVDALRAFGLSLGLAFQAVDDWLGIWGDPTRVGKPRASDLRRRKASLPIVVAMAGDGAASRALRDWMRSDARVDEAAIRRGMEHLDALGAQEATIGVARRELARALESLDKSEFAPAAREELALLARFVVERAF